MNTARLVTTHTALLAHAHPAHALLAVAHALLGPASTIAAHTNATDNHPAPRPAPPLDDPDDSHLPIERVSMPSDDVSDLRDVVDAINKLCDTMKTSCDDREVVDELIEPTEVETYVAEKWTAGVDDLKSVTSKSERFIEEIKMIRSHATEVPMTIRTDLIEETETIRSHATKEPIMIRTDPTEEMQTTRSHATEVPMKIRTDLIEEIGTIRSHATEEPIMIRTDPIEETKTIRLHLATEVPMTIRTELIEEIEMVRSHAMEEPMTTRSDPIEDIEAVISDSELVTVEPMQYEPTSEMYFTASSEVSLLSDMDVQERLGLSDDSDKKRDDRNGVMTGHVAAMREHFESMTRTNTPCPDMLRSSSPSIEVFRTVTNSPDI